MDEWTVVLFCELIIMIECWYWLHVLILRVGVLGLATTRSPIWETPSVSLQSFGDNGKNNNFMS